MSDIMMEALSLSAVGVGTVFIALIVTGLVVALVGHFFKQKPPVPAPKVATPAQHSLGGVDKQTIVLLAAAATVALKRPVRIRRVHFVSHKHVPALWAAVGRVGRSENAAR